MVETKYIHVDRAQAAAAADHAGTNHKHASDHWRALIALHRTLLHEHHDFFLAPQHPSASPALKRLAAKYSMPARMWKHGIHSFLELLRRRLPDSIDYMLASIYLAFQKMAVSHETIPAFEDTCIECPGDLGRYRIAIEDEDIRDRKIWAGIVRSWYTKAADKDPTIGRLYHHLAILAQPNALHQPHFNSSSFTCVDPFSSARESILTLLEPILGSTVAAYSHVFSLHELLHTNNGGLRSPWEDSMDALEQHFSVRLKSDNDELRTAEPPMAFRNFRHPKHYSQSILDHFLRAMNNKAYEMLKGVEHEIHNVSRRLSWWVDVT
jgi:hypothetical protein